MAHTRSSIEKIRAELAWVREPVDPNLCSCRHLRCCEETGHTVGRCPRKPTNDVELPAGVLLFGMPVVSFRREPRSRLYDGAITRPTPSFGGPAWPARIYQNESEVGPPCWFLAGECGDTGDCSVQVPYVIRSPLQKGCDSERGAAGESGDVNRFGIPRVVPPTFCAQAHTYTYALVHF